MKKEDLKVGNILETRCGEKILVCNTDEWINFKGIKICEIGYLKNLIYGNYNEHDIIKVYEDYTLKKVLWERKEKPKLTEDEKTILRNIDKKYKWIARDEIELLCIFIDKPKKESSYWFTGNYQSLVAFNHLFQFITWEDEEPYLISDLLGD